MDFEGFTNYIIKSEAISNESFIEMSVNLHSNSGMAKFNLK